MITKNRNRIISILFILFSLALIAILYRYNAEENQSIFSLAAIILFQFFMIVMITGCFIGILNESCFNAFRKQQIKYEIKRVGLRKYVAQTAIQTAIKFVNSAYNIAVLFAACIYGALAIIHPYIGLAIIAIFTAIFFEYFCFKKSRFFEALLGIIYWIFNFPIMLINAIRYVEIKRESIFGLLILGGIFYGLFTLNFIFNAPDLYDCLSKNGIDSIDTCYKGIKSYLGRDEE